MIQQQQRKQLRDILKPMIMLPQLTKSKSISPKPLSEKVKSAVKPTPKKTSASSLRTNT